MPDTSELQLHSLKACDCCVLLVPAGDSYSCKKCKSRVEQFFSVTRSVSWLSRDQSHHPSDLKLNVAEVIGGYSLSPLTSVHSSARLLIGAKAAEPLCGSSVT